MYIFKFADGGCFVVIFLCLQRLIETGINNKMAIIAQPQLFCAGADIVCECAGTQ
ncbi:Uncharacterised protein [Shigella sonnei]|nr:Uncharacterised protein [Shigella sonnei]